VLIDQRLPQLGVTADDFIVIPLRHLNSPASGLPCRRLPLQLLSRGLGGQHR
jgi:hypothetical protein